MRHPSLCSGGDVLRCDPDFTGFRATVASVCCWKGDGDASKAILATGPFTHITDALQSGWRVLALAGETRHLVLLNGTGLDWKPIDDGTALSPEVAEALLLFAAKSSQAGPLFIACAGGRSRSVALALGLIRLFGYVEGTLKDALPWFRLGNPWAEPGPEPLASLWTAAERNANQAKMLGGGVILGPDGKPMEN